MVGNVGPKQRRESIAPPPHQASNPKAVPMTRRVVDPTKKKEGGGLADLCDVDKAKVARLINHVMVAFKEIQRLKEQLELERSTQEALVAKLQQQNHEVAAEVAQLRLKLASLQLMSPLPSQKVYLHAGKRPCLSPIKEAEREGTGGLVTEGIDEAQTILKERENHSSDFTSSAEMEDNGIFEKVDGTKQCVENAQMGEFLTSNSLAKVPKSRGKENKDPELIPELAGAPHMASEEDAGMLRKRPPPRPLPDLLRNILHRSKGVDCAASVNQSESSVKCVSEGESWIGSVPILHGTATSTVPQDPPPGIQVSRRCFSQGLDSAEERNVKVPPPSQVLFHLSTGLSGGQVGCTSHVPCSQTAMTHLAVAQECQAKTHVDLNGHMRKSEAGGRDVLCCKHFEGGGEHEASNCAVRPCCVCSVCHPCLPNSLQRVSSNLTNVPCSEQLGGSEKECNETSNYGNRLLPKICTSQKKLRFDPTAGEEGTFYYVLDLEKNVKQNMERRSRQPNVSEEKQGVHGGAQTEPVSSCMSSTEGQRLCGDPLENHWTPEAIERRNSFHRIPVVSPRAMNDNGRKPNGPIRVLSDSTSDTVMETEVAGEVYGSKEQPQLSTSESEVFPLRNEKLSSHKLKPQPKRTSKCLNCGFVVPFTCREASQSSKLSSKHARRCSKYSSIVESTEAIHRSREKEKCRGRLTTEKFSSRGEPSDIEFGSMNETSVDGSEGYFSVSDPSTPSRSGNIARCRKCTSRPKSRLFKPVQQKQRRRRVGTTGYVPADEEASNRASVVFCVASEDMYLSTHSDTDYSSQTGRHAPSFPSKACRIHTRKVNKKRGSRRDMKSDKLRSGNSSEPTQKVFDVNRAILDMLRQSDGKQKGQLKGPVADSTECWIETWRFGKRRKSSCNESTDEETSKASFGSFALHGQLDADVNVKRGLKLACDGRGRARHHHHVRGRNPSSQIWKNFDVDHLLDRFIQSNAECAAELIKCSVYFESTSSRPSSQSNIVGEDAMVDCKLPSLPFRNSLASKQGTGSHLVSSATGQLRREIFSEDHNDFTCAQPRPEESAQCSKCGGCVKPGTVPSPAGATEMVETSEHRDLCDTCSVSSSLERTVIRRSADIRPDFSKQLASVSPPIVLPRLNFDDALKTHEGGRQQKSVHHPGTPQILICNVKNSTDSTEDALHDHPNMSGEGHRMPIITGVSVCSQRSTPLLAEEDGTAKGLKDMFDMSLYDLVSDLEGQRRDFWRKVNRQNMEEGKNCGKQSHARRQLVNVGEVHGMHNTRRRASDKPILSSHFR